MTNLSDDDVLKLLAEADLAAKDTPLGGGFVKRVYKLGDLAPKSLSGKAYFKVLKPVQGEPIYTTAKVIELGEGKSYRSTIARSYAGEKSPLVDGIAAIRDSPEKRAKFSALLGSAEKALVKDPNYAFWAIVRVEIKSKNDYKVLDAEPVLLQLTGAQQTAFNKVITSGMATFNTGGVFSLESGAVIEVERVQKDGFTNYPLTLGMPVAIEASEAYTNANLTEMITKQLLSEDKEAEMFAAYFGK